MAEKKPFLLRINTELWEELNRWARDDLRSLNGQIEFLLRRAVQERRKGAARAPQTRPPEGGSEGAGG